MTTFELHSLHSQLSQYVVKYKGVNCDYNYCQFRIGVLEYLIIGIFEHWTILANPIAFLHYYNYCNYYSVYDDDISLCFLLLYSSIQVFYFIHFLYYFTVSVNFLYRYFPSFYDIYRKASCSHHKKRGRLFQYLPAFIFCV